MAVVPTERERERVDITIEAFVWAAELSPADQAGLTRAFNAAWTEWVPGERAMTEAAFVDLDRFTAPPERAVRRLARNAKGEAVGFGQVYWREGPGGCTIRCFVEPAARRQGAGTALFDSLAAEARGEGRDGVSIEVLDGGWIVPLAARDGFQADLTVELNRTDPRTVAPELLERWQAAGERAAGYSLVAYDAPCPASTLAADFVHARHAMNDAPRTAGEAEATYTVEELRALEAASAAASLHWWNVGVRHDASGEMVGLSDMYLPAARPWIVFQGDTGVDPAHRGHGLGAWMKAVNHLRLGVERPDVEIVQTWNAAANEPMLRINRALGFEPAARFQCWYRPFD